MKNTQKPSAMPVHRYRPYHEQFARRPARPHLARQRITTAPRWCAVDLRDGNQALIDPMSPERKRIMFDLLVQHGLQADRGRLPVARARPTSTSCAASSKRTSIPDDVTIQVLTQAREQLIERTYESIAGAKQAIVHLYNSTSILQRDVVFRTDKQGIIDIALQGARWCREFEKRRSPSTTVYYEYSPESYTGTELEFAVDVCNQVHRGLRADARAQGHHQPAGDGRDGDAERLRRLDRVDVRATSPTARTCILSLHPHNDRGTAIAAAELGYHGRRRPHRGLPVRQRRAHRQRRPRRAGHQPVHAGHRPADRLQRPRRGQAHRRVLQPAARCTSAARGPATSSTPRSAASHQDAIKKGFEAMEADAAAPRASPSTSSNGRCPTCRSTRRTSAAATRPSSASTRSPARAASPTCSRPTTRSTCRARLQIEFSGVVQAKTDAEGGEVTSDQIWAIFQDEYLPAPADRPTTSGAGSSCSRPAPRATSRRSVTLDVAPARRRRARRGRRGIGNGPIAAFLGIMADAGHRGAALRLRRARAQRRRRRARRGLRRAAGRRASALWGVGIDGDISTASLKAVVSAVNRAIRTESSRPRARVGLSAQPRSCRRRGRAR